MIMIFWFGLGAIVRFSSSPIIPPVVRSINWAVENSVDPIAYPVEGTYGLENDDGQYWMSSPNLVFELRNPLSVPIKMEVRVISGPNPCGIPTEVIAAKASSINSKWAIGNRQSLVITSRLKAGGTAKFRVAYSGSSCLIDSDPRLFWGSIDKVTTTWKLLA